MKRYLLLISIIFILGFIFIFTDNEEKIIYTNSKSEQIIKSNALTMMYETSAGSGEYQVSSDTSWPQDGYVFNERLSGCENGSVLTWDDENKRVLLETNTSDKCYVYFDKEPPTLAEYIISLYTEDGVNGLYYHDGLGTYTNAELEAGDNSYRFSGANPNNYVCFGSDEASCPADNLYRIIGVFGNQVKLIKATYAPSSLLGTDGAYRLSYAYYWNNSTNNNTWSESNLNTVNLNQNYLNNIGSTWSSKIATTSWIVGGNTYQNIYYYPNGTPKNAYRNEITSPAESTTYSAKIGLMYVSDYYYGASPTYWTYPGYTTSSYPDGNGNSGSSYDYRAATDDNWMYTGISEWTITRRSDNTINAFRVYTAGYVSYSVYSNYLGVRPSFYLEPNVTLTSGDGSQNSPFRLSV